MGRRHLVVWSIGLFLTLGCGRSDTQSVTPVKPPELKAILEKVAEAGTIEDLSEVISTHIEKLETTDAAKAKDLTTDFESLRKATTPAQVKEQAKKMAAKL